MPVLIIPNTVISNKALVWFAIINEPGIPDPTALEFRSNGIVTAIPESWETYTTNSGRNTITYQFFLVPNLQPATNYVLELFFDGALLGSGSTRTLPIDLPFLGDKPFTVLLSSCFSSSKPESTFIGNTYLGLRGDDVPDIKILCGDQVYLDDPWFNFTINNYSRNDLEDIHFGNYVRTWTQSDVASGNRQFLENGPNFFSSDDHEFWNNAPDFATAVNNTYSLNDRNIWRGIASNLLRIFQTDKSVTKFQIGGISFFLADTRVNRGPGKNDFMSQLDIGDLAAWVNGLTATGIVVIGQPIFSKKAGFFTSWLMDKNLPNYAQYQDLARILSNSNQNIVLLTGDVHFARVARCQLSENVFLYEIISSPSALVDPKVGGKWEMPPPNFPDFAVSGVVNSTIFTDTTFQLFKNHFLTLGFYKDGASTKLQIKAVEIVGNGQPPVPYEVTTIKI